MATLFCGECGHKNLATLVECGQCSEPLMSPEDIIAEALIAEQEAQGQVVMSVHGEDELVFSLSQLKYLTDDELESIQFAVMEELTEREIDMDDTDDSDDDKEESLTLKLVLGESKKKCEVELLCGIMTVDGLMEAYEFSKEQLKYLSIDGLEAENGIKMMFRSNNIFPFPHIEVGKKMKNGMTMRILFTDSREVDVKQLTAAERAMLNAQFRAMDIDKDGSLSAEEIRTYFKKQRRKRQGSVVLTGLQKRLASFAKNKHASSQKLEQSFLKSKEANENKLEEELQMMLQMDSDCSGNITLDEFVIGRAASVIASRKDRVQV